VTDGFPLWPLWSSVNNLRKSVSICGSVFSSSYLCVFAALRENLLWLRLGHAVNRFLLTLTLVFVTNPTLAQTPTASPMITAKGTFEVKMVPQTNSLDPGIMTMSIDKQIHGDLEATSKGEMLSAGDPKAGAAGYVAIEQVTGKLAGKSGSFALMHFATMTPGSPNEMKVIVVPGSGTGELSGIYGTFTILIEGGKHSYTFDYGFR
jgi:hypothetical protein